MYLWLDKAKSLFNLRLESTELDEALGWEPEHPSLLEDLENIQP
jgi:hypothetical protein